MPTSNPKLEIYKASAGSGKTFQLALKYISLLLGERQEDDSIRLYKPGERSMHREILAITFTNKATNEMKQRIIKELDRLADVRKKSDYRKTLTDLTGVDDATLARAAKDALTAMLYDYGKMQVSTIDSFFQRVLRSFAYEADLSGNYELSLEDAEIINSAIAETLTQVCGFKSKTPLDKARVTRIRRWVEQIMNDQYEQAGDGRVFDKNNTVRQVLVSFIDKLNNEQYKSMADLMDKFFAAPNAIDNLVAAQRKSLSTINADIIASAHDIQLADVGDMMNKTKRVWVDATVGAPFSMPSDSLAAYLSGEKSPEDMINASSKKKSPALAAALAGKIQVWLDNIRMYCTVELMLSQMYNLGLFREVLEVAARMKVHLNTIMLSDTNTLLNQIIDGSDEPFIYERIGERLHHFLIDEFQDTSKLQWKNLRPLVSNSLGSGFDNLIIGDVKQCIYRFRNSYPDLLDTELENEMRRRRFNVTTPPIDTNWRSAKHIVEFNNTLFDTIGQQYGLTSYNNVLQKCAHNELEGYVDVVSTGNYPADAFSRMVEHMSRQLKSGYKPSDIVILVRKHTVGAAALNALLPFTKPGQPLEGVNIVSSQSLYLKNSNSVRYILAQLRELNRIWTPTTEPDQPVKRSVTPRATDREFDWIQEELRKATAEGMPPEDAIESVLGNYDKQNRRVGLTPTEESAWRERMRGRALFEIVEELVANLPEPSWRETEPQYITAFQDLIADYSRFNAPSIHGFLKLWDEKLEYSASVGLADGADAIRIVTIHASKGLEFDCVHLLMNKDAFDEETDYRWYDASSTFSRLGLTCVTPTYFPIKSNKVLNITDFAAEYKDLQDEAFKDNLNSLYVAMTRAKRELIVTLQEGSKTNNKCASKLLSKALPVIPTENGWEYRYGTPTAQVKTLRSGGGVNTLKIKQYDVFDRLDTWHSTKVSEEEEDENL